MRIAVARLVAVALIFAPSAFVFGQEVAILEVVEEEIELKVGDTLQLSAVAKDTDGNEISDAQILFFGSRITLAVTPGGMVTAIEPGEHRVTIMSPEQPFEGDPDSYTGMFTTGIRTSIKINVPEPPLASISIDGLPDVIYSGTTATVRVTGIDETGKARDALMPTIVISDTDVAQTDGFGSIIGFEPGAASITATVDGIEATAVLKVVANPVRTLEIDSSMTEARTGDVIRFNAIARNADGEVVEGIPVTFSLRNQPDPAHMDARGGGASAMILDDGRFVAEQQGLYTVIAMSGGAVARSSVRIRKRDVQREFEFLSHARITGHRTSDLWIWEGEDGRDYAIVGSWGGNGNAYFYDVTDSTNMELIDTINVDARTVNDVKISDDGKIGVISREGASNRRNGFVVLDTSNPRDVKILSTFDDQITGGVHNVFVYEDHVYAVNNGRRFDIINIEDPRKPVRVSRFETDSPGRTVHDVWVRDGIAYQAGRTDGVIMVDVGAGGDAEGAGSPNKPVEMGRVDQITRWNHAVWPMESSSAGKHYVFAGDETFYGNPRIPEDTLAFDPDARIPMRAGGWIHVVDFDDPASPQEVASYRVGDYGIHNYWIDWDEELLYAAYYQGGLRVLDVSGELLGDLYRQGREVASFFSDDPEADMPNSTMAWGPQPHKGTIFFTDHYSGLWAVKLKEKDPAEGEVEEEKGK